jgi:hypothetical protein
MEQENNHDNFSFDEFLTSDDSKKEFGVESTQEVPVVETQPIDVIEDSSPTPVAIESTPVETLATKTQEAQEDVSHETRTDGAPVRAADEPDWKYDYRMEIWERQQALKNASSDSERNAIKSEMTGIRKEMAQRARRRTAPHMGWPPLPKK